MGSIPIKVKISDNVAISREATDINLVIKENARFAREQGYAPLQTNNKRTLKEYFEIGKSDAQYNSIKHHAYLDLRAGKAT